LTHDAMPMIEEISPHDPMFTANSAGHYFDVSRSALSCIKLALLAADKTQVQRILDLPCGYGRVLRRLKAAFPQAVLTACDRDQDAVDFCALTFGATPVYSYDDHDSLIRSGTFDLIWCGSLLT